MNQPINTDLDLAYLVRPAASGTTARKAIILLHGVGSNEADLFGLAPHLPQGLLVVAPRGPYTLGPGRYAWYEVDFSTGRPIINAAQEADSREVIKNFIHQVKEKFGVDEVYLGGFSQGGIMSYSVGLTSPGEVAGILALSGRLLAEIKPLVTAGPDLQRLQILVVHGTQDGTLPVHYAREAREFLTETGVQLTYREFPIGHQISSEVLLAIQNWLTI
jgi:phospholipase/carboxylesterase